jgi:DNA topoisomerase II
MKEQIQKVSHIEHIIKRPDSYVGEIEPVTDKYWVLNENKFELKSLTFSPALLKIFDEILVNAIDRNSLFPNEANKISVNYDEDTGMITVENDGPLGGISVEEHPTEKIYNPELTFGHLLTSTNYDDSKARIVGGRNGYGAKLANIYSTHFVVKIKDSKNNKTYSQIWESNMTKCNKPKLRDYKGEKSSVMIGFIPDWEKFKMEKMTKDFFKIVEKRVYDSVVCTSSSCKVNFQGKQIKKMSMEQYAKMHLDSSTKVTSLNTERWSVTIAPSEHGFQQVSFVNGICTTKGGTHVDHVSSQICSGIIEDLGKKIKLRPQHVKNTLFVFVKSTLVNPTFSSQVKSECTLKTNGFGSSFVCTQNFIKSVLKTGIQNEVLAISKFQEQKELKKSDGTRKSKITGIPKLDDANKAGTKDSGKCTLILTEGDSAKALAIAGLTIVGRDHWGVFPLRGKCKNVRDASVKQLTSNQEFSDIKKIVGLQQGKTYTSTSELRYGRIMIMTDADHDGSHIKGLLLNMFDFFWPSLLEIGFLVSMVTPIIKATKSKKQLSFFTESQFKDWYKSGQSSGWKIKYYKGLGTSTSKEAQEYFKQISDLTVKFDKDELSEKSIILAFDKKCSDNRKEWLLESTEKHPSELELNYGNISNLSITDFIHKDLVNFSLADLTRSIAHMCDGFKPSQRKVMYACFKKNLKEDMKVAQLAAYVSEKTSYHHGETSLADTIVKLAQNYVGSNNINFLEPSGQFGTRLQGGKDASQTRYIFTHLTEASRNFFHESDDHILKYLEDDGNMIEPEFYMPVMPTILINGSEGIGTGFSSNIPSFNPEDVKENILSVLGGGNIKRMSPWYKNFKGKIVKDQEKEQSWTAIGLWKQLANGKIHVTELPPGRWTQDFKEHLETLVESKTISDFKNNSTDQEVNFEISGYNGKSIEKDLKLTKAIHTSNMHLFHPTKGIKKYATAEDILMDFIEIRIKFYKNRKKFLVNKLEHKLVEISNKARFVKMVTDEELVIFKKKKDVLIEEIKTLKFDTVGEKYDYLLNIKTYQYTQEEIDKLMKEKEDASKELAVLKSTSIQDMWNSDILKC